MDPNNILTSFNTGGTHEQHPQGGIPISQDNQGKLNLVEQGETKYGDYIFSNSLKLTKKQAEALRLDKKYVGKTFADISKEVYKQIEDRPYDKTTKKTATDTLDRIVIANEETREAAEMEEAMAMGIDPMEIMAAQEQGQMGNSFFNGGQIDPATGRPIATAANAGMQASGPQQMQGADISTEGVPESADVTGNEGGPGVGAYVSTAQGAMSIGNDIFGKSNIDTSGKTRAEDVNVAGSTGSGILKGASAGMAFGPWGAAVGGVIGGIGGLIGGKKDKRAAAEANKNNDYAQNSKHVRTFEMGGKIDPKKKDPNKVISLPEGNNAKISYAGAKGLDATQLDGFERQDASDIDWRKKRDEYFGNYRQNWIKQGNNYKLSQSDPEYMKMIEDMKSSWHKQNPRNINDVVLDYRNNGPANSPNTVLADARNFDTLLPSQGVTAGLDNEFRTGGDTKPTNPWGLDFSKYNINIPNITGTSDDFHNLTRNQITSPSGKSVTQSVNSIGSVPYSYKDPKINEPSFSKSNFDRIKNLASSGKFGFGDSNQIQDEENSSSFDPNILGTAARYIPILGNAARYLTAPDAETVAYNRIGDRYRRNYNDEASMMNSIANATGNARRALSESSGGNLGALSSNLQQMHLNELNAVSGAHTQNRQFDMNENRVEQEFNKDTNIRNQGIDIAEKTANEQNRAAARAFKNNLLNTLLQDIGEIGKESKLAEILRNTSGGYSTVGNKKEKGGPLSSLYNDIQYDEDTIIKQYLKEKYGY